MTDCIFCKIGRGEIPSKIVYQDADLFAIEDIAPQAPTHLLICPQKHIPSLEDVSEQDSALMSKALAVAKQLATERKVTDGYRIVLNTGLGAGQTVFHLHFHVIPRFDGVALKPPAGPLAAAAELEPIAAKIRAALAKM